MYWKQLVTVYIKYRDNYCSNEPIGTTNVVLALILHIVNCFTVHLRVSCYSTRTSS